MAKKETPEQVVARLEKELDAAKAAVKRAKRNGVWTPAIYEDYHYVSSDGVVVLSAREDQVDTDRIQFGNVFRTEDDAKNASRAIKIMLIQLQFAIGAGGTGRQGPSPNKGWIIGQEKILPANTLPYDTVVYFPTEESAEACFRYLRKRKLV